MKKLFLLLAVPFAVYGQSSTAEVYGFAIQNQSGYAKIIPGASESLCQYNTNGVCATLAPMYSDPALSNPINNPTYADLNGFYDFFTNPGTYILKTCSPTNYCYSFPIIASPLMPITTAILKGDGMGGALPAGSSDFSSLGILLSANNLSDVASTITSLSNLGGLAKTANLSDVSSPSTALTNLGGLAKSANLSDVANPSTALTNIGGLAIANNLSDVASKPTALNNISTPSARTFYAIKYCTTPASPDETCINNASSAAGSNATIVALPSMAINNPVNIAANQTLVLEPGTYAFGNAGNIVLAANSSLVCPAGEYQTTLSIPSGYTVTTGAVVLSTGASSNDGTPSYQVVDSCGISFFIPSGSTTRTGMVQYSAAAIYAPGASNIRISNPYITGAWNGIVIGAQGNPSGAASNGKIFIDNPKICSFNHAIDLDNIYDTVWIKNLHWWPFRTNVSTQLGAFVDPANYGIYSGRVDDLNVDGALMLGGTQFNFYISAFGTTTGHLNQIHFDTSNGIVMTGGNISVSNSSWGVDASTYRFIDQSGGILTVSNTWGSIAVGNAVNGQIRLTGTAEFNLMNSHINLIQGGGAALDISAVLDQSSGPVIISGNQWAIGINHAYTNPLIVSSGLIGNLILSDNTVMTLGSGSGAFCTLASTSTSFILVHDNLSQGMSYNITPGANVHTHDNY